MSREEALAAPATSAPAREQTRVDRFVIRASGWLGEHTTARVVIVVAALALALTPGAILLIWPDLTESLTGFSYASVFLLNLASTATFYFPVPGLTLAAQTLIATEGDGSDFPWLVGVVGGVGMALGEITAFYAGMLGAEIARGRQVPGPERFRPYIERAIRFVGWLMRRWGIATLFVLSALPNPLFEVAGLTAGSVRMRFRMFIVPVAAGKIVRGMLLAYYGTDVFEGILPFV